MPFPTIAPYHVHHCEHDLQTQSQGGGKAAAMGAMGQLTLRMEALQQRGEQVGIMSSTSQVLPTCVSQFCKRGECMSAFYPSSPFHCNCCNHHLCHSRLHHSHHHLPAARRSRRDPSQSQLPGNFSFLSCVLTFHIADLSRCLCNYIKDKMVMIDHCVSAITSSISAIPLSIIVYLLSLFSAPPSRPSVPSYMASTSASRITAAALRFVLPLHFNHPHAQHLSVPASPLMYRLCSSQMSISPPGLPTQQAVASQRRRQFPKTEARSGRPLPPGCYLFY